MRITSITHFELLYTWQQRLLADFVRATVVEDECCGDQPPSHMSADVENCLGHIHPPLLLSTASTDTDRRRQTIE